MAGKQLNGLVKVFKLRSGIENIRDFGFSFAGY